MAILNKLWNQIVTFMNLLRFDWQRVTLDTVQCTMCRLYSLSSFQPKKLRHILLCWKEILIFHKNRDFQTLNFRVICLDFGCSKISVSSAGRCLLGKCFWISVFGQRAFILYKQLIVPWIWIAIPCNVLVRCCSFPDKTWRKRQRLTCNDYRTKGPQSSPVTSSL